MSDRRELPGQSDPKKTTLQAKDKPTTPEMDKPKHPEEDKPTPSDKDIPKSNVVDVEDPKYKAFVDVLGKDIFTKYMIPSQPKTDEVSVSQEEATIPTFVTNPISPATNAAFSGTTSTSTVTSGKKVSQFETISMYPGTKPRISKTTYSKRSISTGEKMSEFKTDTKLAEVIASSPGTSAATATTVTTATTPASTETMPLDSAIVSQMVDILGQEIFESYMLPSLPKFEGASASPASGFPETICEESGTFVSPTFGEATPAILESSDIHLVSSGLTSEPSETHSLTSGSTSSFYDAKSTIDETSDSETALSLGSIATSTCHDTPLANISESPLVFDEKPPTSCEMSATLSETITMTSGTHTSDYKEQVSMEKLAITADATSSLQEPMSTAFSEAIQSHETPSMTETLLTTLEISSAYTRRSHDFYLSTTTLPSRQMPTVGFTSDEVSLPKAKLRTELGESHMLPESTSVCDEITKDTLSICMGHLAITERGESSERPMSTSFVTLTESSEIPLIPPKISATSVTTSAISSVHKSDFYIETAKLPSRQISIVESAADEGTLFKPKLTPTERTASEETSRSLESSSSTGTITLPVSIGTVTTIPRTHDFYLDSTKSTFTSSQKITKSSGSMPAVGFIPDTPNDEKYPLVMEQLADEPTLSTSETTVTAETDRLSVIIEETEPSSSGTTIKAETDTISVKSEVVAPLISQTIVKTVAKEFPVLDEPTPSRETTIKAETDVPLAITESISQTFKTPVDELPLLVEATLSLAPTASETTITGETDRFSVIIEKSLTIETTIKAESDTLSVKTEDVIPSISKTTVKTVVDEFPILDEPTLSSETTIKAETDVVLAITEDVLTSISETTFKTLADEFPLLDEPTPSISETTIKAETDIFLAITEEMMPSISQTTFKTLEDEFPLLDEPMPVISETTIKAETDALLAIIEDVIPSISETTFKSLADEFPLLDEPTQSTAETTIKAETNVLLEITEEAIPSINQMSIKPVKDELSLFDEARPLTTETTIKSATGILPLSTYQAIPVPNQTTHLDKISTITDEALPSTSQTIVEVVTTKHSLSTYDSIPSTSRTTIKTATRKLPSSTDQVTPVPSRTTIQDIVDKLSERIVKQGISDFEYVPLRLLRISPNCSTSELINGCLRSIEVYKELRKRREKLKGKVAEGKRSKKSHDTMEALCLERTEELSIITEFDAYQKLVFLPRQKKALRKVNSEPILTVHFKRDYRNLALLFRFITRVWSEPRLDLWTFWITGRKPEKRIPNEAVEYIESDDCIAVHDHLENKTLETLVPVSPKTRYLDVPEPLLNRCWFKDCVNPIDWSVLFDCMYCGLRFCALHSPECIHGCLGPIEPFKPRVDMHKRLKEHMCNILPQPAKSDIKYAPSSDVMDANGNGKRGLPKLRDIIRRQREDSDCGGTDSPDLDFVYDDTDTPANEIAELYSYTEQPELQLNVKAFEDQMEQYNLLPSWQRLSLYQKKSIVMKLLDQLEISSKPLRMRAARCILYIAQGCWAEMQSDTEQQHWSKVNCMLLYDLGIFSAFTDLLNIEIENIAAAHVAIRKLAVSLADSQDLRVILSVLYTITEVIRNEQASESTEYASQVESFCTDIANGTGDELMIIKLLGMVTRFCSGVAPHFPMKKVLLLLWKLILVSLGGMESLRKMKIEKRMKADLPPQDEDTMEIARTMRASSPPASASDLLETQNQKRNNRLFRRSLIKQSSLDDHESLGMELDSGLGETNGDEVVELSEYDERRPTDNGESQMYNYQHRPSSPTPVPLPLARGLPWKPKVRQKDIDFFLENSRMKFVGYSLHGDRDSLAGLPQPIHEGVKTLKEHMYTSLAELQIQKEEEVARNPLSTKEDDIEMTSTEILYQAMLPNLPQYMIALLKILLAAAPTSKAKTDSINIMADVLPEEMPMTVVQSMKLGLDVNRHKEIIVKAVSAILLLLLKHFKLNHIYQFEFMSQHLVFANCIPLVLKFFNQNIMGYVGATNMIPILDFPSCVIGDQPELTAESLEIGYAAPYSWRNIFSCINLLRILNKLTKWKHSRIMMLVVFKSAPILKRTLKVRHAMTQLYVLKLLKMQTKYLGRQWRKSNMKTISAIYAKVRHRLNDDWAFGNDLDARPWDFQGEECALRACVDRFNNRRYSNHLKDSEYEPVDNCLNSVLGDNHDLSESFKKHYKLWLEQEVYNVSIEWDKLLEH